MQTPPPTTAAVRRKRYVVATWEHHFAGNCRREVRFAFDRRRQALCAMQIRARRSWRLASRLEWEDLADSLRTANADLLDDPRALPQSDSLPSWARDD